VRKRLGAFTSLNVIPRLVNVASATREIEFSLTRRELMMPLDLRISGKPPSPSIDLLSANAPAVGSSAVLM